jgi:hypothetical protein
MMNFVTVIFQPITVGGEQITFLFMPNINIYEITLYLVPQFSYNVTVFRPLEQAGYGLLWNRLCLLGAQNILSCLQGS